jgi:hypothetical protein
MLNATGHTKKIHTSKYTSPAKEANPPAFNPYDDVQFRIRRPPEMCQSLSCS